MLTTNSVLRRVPANVDPKQAFFIDGIRHSVEIFDLAFNRLRTNLTNIALDPPTSDQLRDISPHIFLDAWAMVDAADRFRMLYQQFPGIIRTQAPGGETLADLMEPIRKARNIADHLAQTADQVLSRDGAALGTLTWLTAFELETPKLWFCTFRPGTLWQEPKLNLRDIVSKFELPTDRICLSIGPFEVNLSDVRPHIETRVKHFEFELETQFERLEFKDSMILNDVFHRRAVKLAPGQFPWQKG